VGAVRRSAASRQADGVRCITVLCCCRMSPDVTIVMTKLRTDYIIMRPILRLEDNIKIDFIEIGCGRVDWIQLFQDTVRWVGSCEYGNEP
jgi:hypothetical protein